MSDKYFLSVLPGPVDSFKAELSSVNSVLVGWKAPTKGGPIDGYKIIYYADSKDPIVNEVPKDVCYVPYFLYL